MYKKILKVSLISALTMGAAIADDVSSRSYMHFRPQFQSASPEREFFCDRDRIAVHNAENGGMLSILGLWSQTVNNKESMRYFAPHAAESLRVAEDTSSDSMDRELDAKHFNITTSDGDFASTVSFKPRQKVWGFALAYHQRLSKRKDTTSWWGSISAPIIRVENDMRLEEKVTDTGGGTDSVVGLDSVAHVATIKDAFKQSNWKYGKIKDGGIAKWGVADVEVRLGYNWIDTAERAYGWYLGASIPTGKKIDPEYLFSPVIGNNKHFGLIYGANAHMEIWHDKEADLYFNCNIRSAYFFQNTQQRAIDLKGKAWSRYMAVYKDNAQATAQGSASNAVVATSGINEFTREVDVNPRMELALDGNFNYQNGHFQGEFGYNVYARASEKVELTSTKLTMALKDEAGEGKTNIARDIRNVFASEPIALASYTAVKAVDLDMESASDPGKFVQTMYAGLGYNWSERKYPVFMGLGGSYAYSSNNYSMDSWMLFGKLGISF